MKYKVLILILCVFGLGYSQNPNRLYKNASFQNDQLIINVSDGVYKIKAYNPFIIETTFIPQGELFDRSSHAVILEPKKGISQFFESDNIIRLSTEGINVSIKKQPFQITYSYKNEPIISEQLGYVKNDSLETIAFNLKQDEILYGAGARALGMNRRGHRLELYNRAHYGYETHSELMNYTMPLVLSSQKYMIHFDNAPIGFLDLDSQSNNILKYETISGRKTYQIVVADSWIDLIDNYTDLTGKHPLPPRWALGNFASRFGYHSQEEVETTVQKFRDEEIPLDAVIIDIFWFGKDIQGHMGNLEFLKDSFPDPREMIKDLNRKDINTILVSEPFVLTTSKRWDEVVSKDVMAKDSLGNPFTFDFYFGNTGLIDIYNPKGKSWFWTVYKELADMGVTGIWGDLGEPEVHPKDLIHATGTANEVHNIYGHDWARLIAEGYAKDFPNQRPFILMRAGYSGSQRFGMMPWSGDVNRSWGGLQSQPEIALQMGMQGLGYMHSDLGGFAGSNKHPELYVRWLQYGVFQPIFRPHAQEEVPAEPVFWDDHTKALAKKAIQLRYQLLPYNYTLSFNNHTKGTPLMRPLFFDDDSDRLLTDASSYLWGNDFLIAPVLKSQVVEKEVYFPKNSSWFDFYNDKKYEGGTRQIIPVLEDHIPTFIRGGAFIPMTEPIQSTKDYNPDAIQLHFYFDPSKHQSTGKLYIDDGLTAEVYQKGQFEILHFNADVKKRKIELTFNSEIGSSYQSKNKQIHLVIHNISKSPKWIKLDGKKHSYIYDETRNILKIQIEWNSREILETKIKLK